ncbi:dihydrodipicolinate reductase [Buchnera aphidicola str. Bp (Baizongia pistaciae)]|uniref:4-hydroxy-tetrahydrodipicolinate reductase n=1 Tax=Buchnera aphidicola subsp. Baizongia pistaciae (strain Bp) TaxID=224915 RepID=DAPB_BUCBP|nr:4-hydroxy-tetrahydrodipicolinate reductase [Buchnera aphidicola]P59474.1 RecName: Full=4-hydroxy-tetrahydrodipicolinate reductase; Short=HTPA reductase [Buchnera aphidicola str. Bp (Baizongia pistaciae)]AAO26870.1 dihydrodipicolinate reductase [Buchnera aphidicola str. Bp (Baizongia pistaciae)]
MKKTTLNIAISGALGKMGINLIHEIYHTKNVFLTAAIVKNNSPYVQKNVGKITKIGEINIPITNSLEENINKFDILIDFTNPKTTLKNLEICAVAKKNIIIGTTGFTQEEQKKIKLLSKKIGIVQSSNYSIGINLMISLLEKTTQIIGKNTDIEIIEAHHNKKIDAPSGTSLEIGKKICKTMNWDFSKQAIYERHSSMKSRANNEIGFSSIRAGNIVGEHKVLFANSGEHIEITHKAISRSIFSKGAIQAAIWLFSKNYKNGLFNMNHILNI